MALRGQQAGTGQGGKMGRDRVLRDIEMPRDVSGGQPVRFVAHQQAEDLQPRGLGQRVEGRECGFCIHKSTITDIWDEVKTT
ncbi:hypothetical protein BJI49_13150 [Acetobacter pasteurianus]|nr:hypothetical protein BJI49_13150 [Acetobacter pasteurianus]